MYTLRSEKTEDWWEVEALYDLCFAPGREALSSYRLRDGVPTVAGLSRVARDADDILSGAIRYWPVRIGDHTALLLGPIAVHPTRQGEGLGGALIRNSLSRAQDQGWARVMLVGDVDQVGPILRDSARYRLLVRAGHPIPIHGRSPGPPTGLSPVKQILHHGVV